MVNPSQLEFSALGRQQSDELLTRTDALTAGQTVTFNVRRVSGYGAMEVYARGSTAMEVRVAQSCQSGGPFTNVFTFRSTPVGSFHVLSERFATTAPFIEVELEELDVVLQTALQFCLTGLPVGSVPDSNNGLGSPGGPGNTIVTKADLVIAAATNTAALLAADIPVGTRRVTITNVGANPVRLKATGEGGGATRGVLLSANQAITIGDLGGSIATLDAFSTLGTTLAFFFERN